MKTKSIKKVVAWAIRNRPPEYISELKSKCSTWNIEDDFYTISIEAWNELADKYGGKRKEPPRPGKCMYVSCMGCSGGIMCGKNPGMDCGDPYNQECKFRG